MKKTTTVNYGGVTLPVSDSTDPFIPVNVENIVLSPDNKKTIAHALLLNKPILLVGEAGTGKSSIVRELAQLTHSPYVSANMTGYTTPDELIGSKSVKNGATYYEMGIITDAMKRGAFLNLEELNATSPDSTFIIHGLLDDNRKITMPNGDVIVPAQGFRFFATMNPNYEGTKQLNKALINRFVVIAVDILSPIKEKTLLIKRTGITEGDADTLVTIATMLRKDYAENKILTYVSTRSLLYIAELIKNGLEPRLAFQSVIVNKADTDEEKHIIRDIYNSVLKQAENENDDEKPVVTTRGELNRIEAGVKEYSDKLEAMKPEIDKIISQKRDLEAQLSEARGLIETGNRANTEQAAIIKLRDAKIAELAEQVKQYKWIEERLKKAAEGSVS